MTEQEWDDLMRRALLDAIALDMQEYQARCPEPPEPSARYQRWEKRFLADPFGWDKRRARRAACKKPLQTAAAFAVVSALALAALPAARAQKRTAADPIRPGQTPPAPPGQKAP